MALQRRLWTEIASSDISNAIGALDQSYAFTGFHARDGKLKSFVSGTTFRDQIDDCDRNNSCDIVCGVAAFRTREGGIGF